MIIFSLCDKLIPSAGVDLDRDHQHASWHSAVQQYLLLTQGDPADGERLLADR